VGLVRSSDAISADAGYRSARESKRRGSAIGEERGQRLVCRTALLFTWRQSRRSASPGAWRVHAESRRRLVVTATAAYRIVKPSPLASIALPIPVSNSSSFSGGNKLWPPNVGTTSSHSSLV